MEARSFRGSSRSCCPPRAAPCLAALSLLAALLLAGPPAAAQEDDSETGRDFPKTLTLDEPGIDDEISLPTVARVKQPEMPPGTASTDTDVTVEIDKRLTQSLELQINGGYREMSAPNAPGRTGWDDVSLTSKYVVLDQPKTETILTLGVVRGFGGSGAVHAGADAIGSTTPTFYFGQGLGATRLPTLLRPFALTGTIAYDIPDRARGDGDVPSPPALQVGMSLQYSLHYLSSEIARAGLPDLTRNLVAVAEGTYDLPLASGPGTQLTFAPGLIYAGSGYQLAAEALLPSRGQGGRPGFIAQLNLSFRRIGLAGISGTLW